MYINSDRKEAVKMAIMVINESDGKYRPKRTPPEQKIQGTKIPKSNYEPNIMVVEQDDEEQRLIKQQKRRPFDIHVNIKLARYYRARGNWPEAEHHEEIVEYLDRIRRFVKNR
jgi:hypothetical protein